MAFVRRHDRLLLRLGAAVMMVAIALVAPRAHAQSAAPGSAAVTPLPTQDPTPTAPHERVLDIRIVGNRTISRDKVVANIGTKINEPFDQATFDADVRKLVGKSWFVHVEPFRERVPGGVIITLRVVERPTLEYVRYLGWKKIKPRTLNKQTNLKAGDALDPFAVEEGARKIETYYQTKGFNDVRVDVLEGTKPSDHGAIYLINEGKSQKVWAVNFEGNTIASDGRLQTQIQTKPPLLKIFKGHVDRAKIEGDVERLTDYYRGLGYFKAHVGHDYEWNDEEDWMTLTFYINEGPRYKIRNIAFLGNQIYDNAILSDGLKLRAGEYFDRTRMNTDIGYIKDLYGATGYVFADAQPELQFELEPGIVDLVYKVTEGDQCLVGDIRVHIAGDNPHTRTLTAIHRLGFRPGDIIDIRDIRSSERRIKSSGLFNVDPTKGDVPRIVLTPPEGDPISPDGSKQSVARGGGGRGRGQSPDPRPNRPVARFQSPDNGSGGYGGQMVNPIAPGGSSYSGGYPNGQSASGQPISGQPINAQPARGYPPARPANTPYTAQAPGNYQASPSGTYPLPSANPMVSPGGAYPAQAPGGYSTQPPIVGAPPSGSIYPPSYTPPPAGYAQGGAAGPGGYPGGFSAEPVGLPSPAPEPLLDDRPRIPVDIYLNEAQTGRFMFGAGVNSNAGLVGSIVLDEQNFDWRRFPTSWEDFRSGKAFRGAGQKFRIEAAPGTQVSRYMFNFAEPYLLDTQVSFGLSGYYFQRFYQDWNEQRTGGRTSIGYQFSPDLSGSLGFRGEDVLISNPQPSDTNQPLMLAVLGHTQMYSFSGTMAWDTRDNTFLPTQGNYVALSVAYTEGTFQFPTYTLDFRKFFLIRERPDGSGRHVLSMYNQFGITGSDTPIYERFFAGGFSTLRGYRFRGASPVAPAYVSPLPPSNTTIQVGGIFQNLSSVEYMFPLTADDMLRGVVFCDFGTVEQSVKIVWDNFRVAPGMGIRVTLPALGPAPIAIDFAVPVASASTDQKQLVQFFVGYSR